MKIDLNQSVGDILKDVSSFNIYLHVPILPLLELFHAVHYSTSYMFFYDCTVQSIFEVNSRIKILTNS